MSNIGNRIFSAAILAGLLVAPSGVAQAQIRVVTMSKYDFRETVNKVKGAIEAEGFTITSVVDHQAVLKEAGTPFRGWVLIEFTSPKYAKEILLPEPESGLDLPLRISVMEGDPNDPHGSATHAVHYRPSVILGEYRKVKAVAAELDKVLERIAGSVAKTGH